MAEIFNIDMESALTGGAEWTSATIGASQGLVRATDSGLFGSVAGAKLTIGGTANVYVEKTFTAISSTACTFRIAIADLVGLTMATSNAHMIYQLKTASATAGWLEYKDTAGTRTLQLIQKNDAGTQYNTSAYTITGSTTYIQLKYEKSSVNAATDAAFSLYFDDTLKERKTGLEIYDTFNFNAIRVGGMDTIDSGTTGVWKFDKAIFRDDSTLPGSPQADPTVTDISNQTGTFGTPKSVACTLNAGTSDIARCDVSTDGTALITLTASGAATVTNNGTTAPYVTGSSADVIATLGNNISISGVRAGTEFSHVETITVLATDSLSATGNDTFTMTWSVPTGVGTQTLYLTGTHAQLNAALATVEFTGTVIESIDCLMYSVTSTPLTDTDIFNITVVANSGVATPSMKSALRSRRRRKKSGN